MDDTPAIDGVELLVDRFGFWPSFHDAEVLWIRLDRSNGLQIQGPTVEMLVHVFEMTSEVTEGGYYRLKNHSQVHFRFEHVTELQIDGFNHQNAIFGLAIVDETGAGWENKYYKVTIDPSYGIGGTFYCVRPEILSVSPCNADGTI
jgi:hypothetical protein